MQLEKVAGAGDRGFFHSGTWSHLLAIFVRGRRSDDLSGLYRHHVCDCRGYRVCSRRLEALAQIRSKRAAWICWRTPMLHCKLFVDMLLDCKSQLRCHAFSTWRQYFARCHPVRCHLQREAHPQIGPGLNRWTDFNYSAFPCIEKAFQAVSHIRLK